MLTNEPKQSIVPLMRGIWKGHFIYGPSCPVELAGKQSCFTTLLNDKSDGHFAGSGKNSGNMELPSAIEGHITVDRIIFSYEERDGSFSAIFKGAWDSESQQFCGTWKTACTGESAMRGDWIMEFDRSYTLTQDAGRRSFHVHLDEHELRDIYCNESIERGREAVDKEAFLPLTGIFFLLSVLSAIPVYLDGSFFIQLICACLVASFIVSSLFFISATVAEWKWQWKSATIWAPLWTEPDFAIHLDNEQMELSYPSGKIIYQWNEFTSCGVHRSFILLGVPEQLFIFPRGSMSADDFYDMQEHVSGVFSESDSI